MRKITLFICVTLLSVTCAFAQSRAVTGTIYSKDDNLPILGATIVVDKTQLYALSDNDGKFTIENVPQNSMKLIVSNIGFNTKEVLLTNSNLYNIILEPDNVLLDEVVVTGYGNFKKASYTGSASVVGTDKLKDLPVVSVSQMLEANVPGLTISSSSGQAGSTSSMRVRGMGSINASNQPLIVLDGVPMMFGNMSADSNNSGGLGILSTINPSDIESITVLKDASSTSLYGARGSNGVILITTKKGKEGKTTYSFKANYGVSNLAYTFRDLMSGEERRETIYEGYINNRLNRGETMEQAIAYADKNIDNYASRPKDGYSDWKDAMFHSGHQQNYTFGISGGTQNTNFSASLGYTNQEGISLSSGFERYTMRANFGNKYRNFEFNLSTLSSLTSSKVTPEGGYYASAMYSSRITLTPSIPIYNEDGTYNKGFSNNGGYNPLNEDEFSDYYTKVMRLNNSAMIAYNFLPSLRLSTTLNVDYASTKEFRYWGPETNDGKSSNGEAVMRMLENSRINSITMLSYNKDIKKNNVNAVIAYEVQDTRYEGLTGRVKGYGQNINNTLTNGSTPSSITQPKTKDALVSYVARANYDYDSRYYLSATFRRDGSSRLSKEGRWCNFWSVSGSWRVTAEDFMEPISKWLSDFKIRASYGVTGNLPNGLYDYFGSYSTSAIYDDQPAISENRIPFPGLTWEKGKQWNIGADLTFIGRISLVLDVYKRNTKDLLMSKPLNNVSGFSSMTANVGEMQNSGVEIEVRSTNIVNNNFSWHTSLNVSTNKNKIIKLADLPQYVDGRYMRKEGESWSTFYLREYVGVDPENGLPQYYTNKLLPDGSYEKVITNKASEASPILLQSMNPKVFGGLTNTFKYRGFDLSFNLSFTLGGHSYDNYMWILENDGYSDNNNISTNLRKRWKKPGDITDVPRYVLGNGDGGYYNSSRGIHSSDHLRLKSLSFGYSLPQNWMKSIGFNNVRVYFSGTNLLTWAKYDQYDPELTGVVDMGVPPLRTFTFGIDFSL